MSGNAGGRVAVLPTAPTELAAAAAAGLACGAEKMRVFLREVCMNYVEKTHTEKTLKVSGCSAELEAMYANMESLLRRQADMYRALTTGAELELLYAARQLRDSATTAADMTALNGMIRNAHADISKVMTDYAARAESDILTPGGKTLLECTRVWLENEEARVNMLFLNEKNNLAPDSLRDAIASLNLMYSLASSSRDESFRLECDALTMACHAAEEHYKKGVYGGAFSISRTVIRQAAMSVARLLADQMELGFARIQLQARMEGLIEEMKCRRCVRIFAEDACYEDYEVDLDEFSQHQYSVVQDLLAQRLQQVRNSANLHEIREMTEEYEHILEPRALKVMEVSQLVMQGCSERLRVLEMVSEHMVNRDFTVDWVAPVGGDQSQKLVVHFLNHVLGHSISVTLDSRAETGDITNMAMEVLFFSYNGHPVTEKEKWQLCDSLNGALREAGVMGFVSCREQWNQSAVQPRMDTEASVLQAQVQRNLFP